MSREAGWTGGRGARQKKPSRKGKGVSLVAEPSVLIVDRSEETREVLTTALERRGVKSWSAGDARGGLELAQLRRPDLIVLDLELDETSPEEICAPFARESEAREKPIILLGTTARSSPRVLGGEFVSKPYHYGPLVRRIEELLDTLQG